MALLGVFLGLAHFWLGLWELLVRWVVRLENLVGFSYRKMMKFHNSSPSQFRQDSKSLSKLPLHLGIVILEDDISFADVANIVVWCMAMGISCISIYDRSGISKRSKDAFHKILDKHQKLLLGKDSCNYHPHLHCGWLNNTNKLEINGNHNDNGICSSGRVDVILLSVEDGRQHLVNTAKDLCREVSSHQLQSSDIIPSFLDNVLKDSPDLSHITYLEGLLNAVIGRAARAARPRLGAQVWQSQQLAGFSALADTSVRNNIRVITPQFGLHILLESVDILQCYKAEIRYIEDLLSINFVEYQECWEEGVPHPGNKKLGA